MEHNAREIAVAFPAHLREMFNQTVSAKLAFWEPHIRQVTKEGKTYKVASKKDSWLVLTYKDLYPCCVEAIKEFVRKTENIHKPKRGKTFLPRKGRGSDSVFFIR